MSCRDPKTWWILTLLPQGLYTISIKLHIRAKKVINVSSTNIVGDTWALILSRETQLAPSTRNTFPIKTNKQKIVICPKVRIRWPMQHCLLTESLPQWSLIDSYHQVGPNVELTSSWAGEVPIGISLKLVAYWQGRAMHCQIAGQDLLLSNRIYWVVAAWAQEGLEELLHIQGQVGGRETITSSKVRSSGCALLEQPWRDYPRSKVRETHVRW